MINISQLLAQGITFGTIYALMALGFHVVYVSTGVLNFALGEQLAVSGLITLTLITAGLPLAVAFVATVAIGAAIAALYQQYVFRPAERMGKVGPIVGSVGVLIVIFYGRMLLWPPEPRSFPPFSGEPNQAVSFLGGRWLLQTYWVIGVAGLILVALTIFFRYTGYGRAWRAVAQNPLGASLSGINPNTVAIGAVALAGGLATAGGVLISPIVLAGGFYGLDFTVKGFAATVIGGFYSTPGVVVGGLLVGILESLAIGFFSARAANIILYTLLVLMLLVKPSGLFGRAQVAKV